MSPVEGERFFNGRSRGRLDAIEPGDSQDLLEMHPILANISCSMEDLAGSLQILKTNKNAFVYKQFDNGRIQEMECGTAIYFKQDQRVIVHLDNAEKGFIEEWVFWHVQGRVNPNRLRSMYQSNR